MHRLRNHLELGRAFVLILCAGLVLKSENASAVGYDKGVMFSGRYSGLFNAVTSSAAGVDALILNPAGVASFTSDTQNGEVTVNFSPALVRFSAPVRDAHVQEHTKGSFLDRTLLPASAVGATVRILPNLAFGVASGSVGGNVADYGELSYADQGLSAFKPVVKGDLRIYELTTGLAYEFFEGFRIGAAWRISHVRAEFSSVAVTPGVSMVEVHLKDLKDTNYEGFRFGAQYAPPEQPFGVGVNVRTAVKFDAKGGGDGRAETILAPGTTVPLSAVGDVSVSNTFPLVLSAGAFYRITDHWKLFGNYSWYRYSVNKNIGVKATLENSTKTLTVVAPDIKQNWQDANELRFAAEYTGLDWALRAGVGYASAVVAKSTAMAAGEPPGEAYGFAVGAGRYFLENRLEANFAVDYSFGHAEVANNEAVPSLAGDYDVSAYTAHTGVTYHF